MSFASESIKQRLNLSIQAYEVIQNDMSIFDADSENLSGFINRIFTYFAPVAEASVSLVLRQLEDKLEEMFFDIPGDSAMKQRIVRKLLRQEEDRLKNMSDSYGSGKQIIFSLNSKNLTYLLEKSECREEKYYKKRGDYIKSVIEEYARLPYVQREMLYFSPFINEINAAIGKADKERCQLRVVTGDGKIYSFYPYGILCDPLSTATYLVGYSKRYDHPKDVERPVSFRISALGSIKAEKSKRAFLPKEKWRQLKQTISSRGVQFLASGEEEIKVRLSESGKKKYNRQIHLRPARAHDPEGDIYTFNCTATQADFYFFKFGADAEILQPPRLREEFITRYRNALNVYLAAEHNLLDGSDER